MVSVLQLGLGDTLALVGPGTCSYGHNKNASKITIVAVVVVVVVFSFLVFLIGWG